MDTKKILKDAQQADVKKVLKNDAPDNLMLHKCNDFDPTDIKIYFDKWDKNLLGKQKGILVGQDVVLYINVKVEELNKKWIEENSESINDTYNEFMSEHQSKLPKSIQDWKETDFFSALIVNNKYYA